MDQSRYTPFASDLDPRSIRPAQSFRPITPRDTEQSIPARFELLVERNADRPAVKFGDVTLSYSALNRRANRLARTIVGIQGMSNNAVAILMPQGASLIVAILGILKAAKPYVGLDPSYPISRLNYVLEDSQINTVVTNNQHIQLAAQLAADDIEVINIDAIDVKLASGNMELPISPDSLAYIFYTSGSTGRPKGVFDSHRNVLHNVLRYTNTLYIGLDDRLTLLQSSSFSGSVSSIFGALLNGACVLPFDIRQHSFAKLARWLREEKITIYHSVPAIFRAMLANGGTFPDVRLIRLEGDQASRLHFDLFKQCFGDDCWLVNGLGTTETGLVRQFFANRDTKFRGGLLPLGYAVKDMEVLVVDENLNPVPARRTGEIAVVSEYLALGYWQNKELTERKFFLDKGKFGSRMYLTGDLGRLGVDGNLEFLGRLSGRTKVRGHTIDFAEIEIALLELNSVAEVVVQSCNHDDHGECLVAYYVPTAAPGPTVSQLRVELSLAVPDYAMPSFFVALDSLPRDANEKMDRRALPHPGSERPRLDVEYVPSRSLVQSQLIQIWEPLLKLQPVGILDNFFDLGGDSLLVLGMLLQVQEIFGVEIPGHALLPSATVEHLAHLIYDQGQHLQKPVVKIQDGRSGPPLFFLHGDYNSGGFYCLRLATHLDQDIPFYALPPCGLDGGNVPPSYGDMADRHLAAIRQTQPKGPYYIGGTCNGGMVAYEIARRLSAQGEEVALLALVAASAANLRFRWLNGLVTILGSLFGYAATQRCSAFLRLREMITNFQSRTIMRQITFVLRKSILIPKEMLRLLSPSVEPPTMSTNRTDIWKTYRAIDDQYIPEVYSGKVILIWPFDEPETGEESAAVWRCVADDVELRTLASNHFSLLTQDAEFLAMELNACYQAAVRQTSTDDTNQFTTQPNWR